MMNDETKILFRHSVRALHRATPSNPSAPIKLAPMANRRDMPLGQHVLQRGGAEVVSPSGFLPRWVGSFAPPHLNTPDTGEDLGRGITPPHRRAGGFTGGGGATRRFSIGATMIGAAFWRCAGFAVMGVPWGARMND